MGSTQGDITQQHRRGDGQRPTLGKSEHHLEHHQSGNQLAGEVEQQDQREHGGGNAQRLRPIALTQVFRYRSRSGEVAVPTDCPLANQNSQVKTQRVEKGDPQGGHSIGIGQPRQTEKRGAAGRRRRERQGQHRRTVAAARHREIVSPADATAPQVTENRHRHDVTGEEQPGP